MNRHGAAMKLQGTHADVSGEIFKGGFVWGHGCSLLRLYRSRVAVASRVRWSCRLAAGMKQAAHIDALSTTGFEQPPAVIHKVLEERLDQTLGADDCLPRIYAMLISKALV
jgi:hypothetical protein